MAHRSMTIQEFIDNDYLGTLGEDELREVRRARQIAADTIFRLEPRHIWSFKQLEDILATALAKIRVGKEEIRVEKFFQSVSQSRGSN